jgi:hypothetical protein
MNQLQPVSLGSRYDHPELAGEGYNSVLPVAAPRIFFSVMEQRQNSHVLFKTQENT